MIYVSHELINQAWTEYCSSEEVRAERWFGEYFLDTYLPGESWPTLQAQRDDGRARESLMALADATVRH